MIRAWPTTSSSARSTASGCSATPASAPTPQRNGRYDLYWIAVRRRGAGQGNAAPRSCGEVERRLRDRGARMLRRRDLVASRLCEYARAFYDRRGYTEAARIRDFYAPGDDRIMFTKRLAESSPRARSSDAMSDWQKILQDESIEHAREAQVVRRRAFGADVAEREIDVEALQPAFDNFQMRITPSRARADQGRRATRCGISTSRPSQELDDRRRRDRLARRGRRLAGAEHHAPVSGPRAVPRQPGLRELLPLLHAAPQSRRPGEDSAQPVRVGVRVHRGAPGDPRRHPVGRRPDDALRPPAGVHLPAAARDPARRDHPARQPHHVAPAGAHHARVLRDGEEVPPHLHEHALQPPERADARRRRRARPAAPTPASRSAARRCCSRE